MKKQLLFIGTLALLISVVMSSCSNFRYTNYGKPLDFLHAKRFKAKTQKAEDKRSSEETLVMEEVKEAPIATPETVEVNAVEVTDVVAVTDKVEVKEVQKAPKSTKKSVPTAEVEETQLAMVETVAPEVSKKQVRKANKANSTIRKFGHSNTTETTADILILLLCIFIPPLAVFLVHDIGREFWINLILTIVGFYIIGIIHALIVCM